MTIAATFVPPCDVERVPKGARDIEIQAGGEVDQKPRLGERQEFGGLPQRDPLHEPHQTRIEESSHAQDQREPQEMQALEHRPEPLLRTTKRL
jgi:hypothetical protein